MLQIRNIKMTDLQDLVMIENLCFSKEEAATEEAFKMRIQLIPDSFFVAEEDGIIKGLINGPVIENSFITDDLFSEIKKNPLSGGHQSILGLAVLPKYHGQGVAAALLSHLEQEAKNKGRKTVTLTCKEELLSFYEKHGYLNSGVSNSKHGGVVWYNMNKSLQ